MGDILEDFAKHNGDKCYLWRNRPYVGQPHTDNGVRGKTEVKGITFRDLKDAFVLAAFDAANDQDPTGNHFERERQGYVTFDAIYRLDLNKLDPIAWQQNFSVRVEKMMGIFPNIKELT